MTCRVLLGLALAFTACADTGQERVALPLYLAGTDLSAPVQSQGDIPLHIDRAELAFGPLYLCAGNTAGELCETARLEWLDSRVVDLTVADPEVAGQLTGTSGPVRSFMYDLGISAQLTREQPFVLAAAAALEDASLRVEGRAELAETVLPFRAEIAIQQSEQTELGVPVVRKSVSEEFSHEVQPGEPGLLVRFDAHAWLSRIDLRPYLAQTACRPDGPPVCARNVEYRCDEAGASDSTRDCSELDQVCLAGLGCRQALDFEHGSEPYRALRNALLVGQRPSFEWGFAP